MVNRKYLENMNYEMKEYIWNIYRAKENYAYAQLGGEEKK